MEAADKNKVPAFLSEPAVALLESHWSDLRKEAYCEATGDGWEVHLLPGASLFPKAGFTQKILVSGVELLKHARTSAQKGVVERLLAILEHICVAPGKGAPTDVSLST